MLTSWSLEGYAQGQQADTLGFEIENPLQESPSQYEILGVEVEGTTTVRENFVTSTSGLEEGTQITVPGEDIGQAIKRLNRTGLFSDIRVIQTGRTATGIYLKIIVQEQPRLADFSIEGVKRSQRKDLEERVNLLSGFAVTESSISQAINTIKTYFKEEGYWETRVETYRGQRDTVRNRVSLTFRVDPGERYEIKDIEIEGNTHFREGKIRRKMKPLKEDAWWKIFGKKLFKEEDFQTAKQNVRDLYGKNGFRDFYIQEDSVYLYEYKEDKKGVKVYLEIYEGPQYKVRDITWEGNTVYTDENLTETLDFEKGDVFNSQKFEEKIRTGEQSISALYQNVGYLFSNIQPEIQVIGRDSLDIHVSIYEGEIATIKEVNFAGNNETHDEVIRRSLRTVPGMTYSRAAIMRTMRELSQLGYFQPDAITPNLNPDPEQNTVDITYNLDESRSTDNFEFSGGFGGRGIGLILQARVNFNNFSIQRAVRGEGWNPIPSGDGQKLSIGAQVTGGGFQSYNLGFQEPWLGGKPNSLGVNFNYNLFKFNRGRNEMFSSSVSLGRRLKWPDDYFSQQTRISYQLFNVRGGASFLGEGNSSILSITEIIERNSVNNPINPTTGSKLRLSLEVAPPLPTFSQFFKVKWLYQNHTPIVGELVLTNTVQYGYLGYLGSGQRSNFQRFELGGTQLQQRQSFLTDNIDLRGFPGGRSGSITPRRNGQRVGGRIFSKYTLELRYPAISEQQVQFMPYSFFDAGNAYLNFDTFAPFNVKRAAGFGARIYLPVLGLVDVSYGYRLDGIPGTPVRAGEWEFLFNIGSPF